MEKNIPQNFSDSSPNDDQKFLVLGRVVGIHGLRGDLKVFFHSGSSDALHAQEECILQNPQNREVLCYNILRVRDHKKNTLVALEGVRSADEAGQLVGFDVLADRTKLPPLPDGEYYWFQIENLRVYDQGRKYLGQIKEIISTPANDVYVVQGEGEEILIPAVEDVVLRIDLDDGLMVVDPPEGLIDAGDIKNGG